MMVSQGTKAGQSDHIWLCIGNEISEGQLYNEGYDNEKTMSWRF